MYPQIVCVIFHRPLPVSAAQFPKHSNDYIEMWTFDRHSLVKEHEFNSGNTPKQMLIFRKSVMI